jgi:hypothetical protein
VFSYDSTAGGPGIRANLKVGKLPSLRVVPIDALLMHEQPDQDRWRPIRARIESEGLLKHPPIAARDHGSATHILLDGVNRVEAVRSLGARWLMIQEVDLEDDGLVLSTWHHVVEGPAADDLINRIGRTAGVSSVKAEFTPDGDFEPTFDDDTACLVVCRDRAAYAVSAPADPAERLDIVSGVVDIVHKASSRDRVSYTNLADLEKHYSGFTALVCYKAFAKRDVLELSLSGRRFPSGVTRFSVPKRALYFDLPLAFLRGGDSVEAKQRDLDELIGQRIRAKKIRFYVEPTFIFDD